ncbi:MAG: cytochrome c biogenesis protein CcsA, partial [Dehalococcoidales bacterium]|nr:cytochrome c biogenesis protein CcsA [Dehalococcoidales bacterium]
YVGLTIPFAIAVAALVTGKLEGDWIQRARPWALFAWLMLGIGNVLGAQWAYVELGWGGYWAWDPVENASLMPWLIATAFLHAAVVQRRTKMFRVWSVGLIAAAFLLSIFGTFITRSGIISSVHAYGQSALGPFFLVFLTAAVVFSVGLIAWRWSHLRRGDDLETFMSRENWVLLTNFVFIGATVTILLGTLYPVLSELFTGQQIQLDISFYNRVDGPVLLLLIAIMGICPILAWRRSSREAMLRGLLAPAAGALVVGVALVLLGVGQVIAVVAFAVCAFVIFTHAGVWYRGVRQHRRLHGGNPLSALAGMVGGNRPRYGAHIVHVAIAVMAVGVIGSSFLGTVAQANLKVGQTMDVGGYTLRYEGLAQSSTPSKEVFTATVTVLQNGRVLGQMTPETYFPTTYQQTVSEVAIRTTPQEDLYVILAGWADDGSATFNVHVNPLVVWIWVGGALLLFGGAVALWPEPRLQPRAVAEEAAERLPSPA